jgi:hypothetical protein
VLARGVSTYIFLSRQTQSSTQKVLQMRGLVLRKDLENEFCTRRDGEFFLVEIADKW